jgi:hypothetical protein
MLIGPVTALSEGRNLAFRTRDATRPAGKDQSECCHGISCVWNHLVRCRRTGFLKFIDRSTIIQGRDTCEASLSDLWCARRFHSKSGG